MTQEATPSYDSLKHFLSIMFESLADLRGLEPEEYPMALLAVQESRGRSAAMRALTTAISDLFVVLKTRTPERKDEINRKLEEAGAPSVALVAAWLSKKNGKVLQRGFIKTDDEFEQISTLRDDVTLSEEERMALQRLLDKYEFGK